MSSIESKVIDQESISILKEYFEFDKIFHLFEYDQQMEKLYYELELLKREEYPTNYRFIFLHYDTEYYITDDCPGFTLTNLQRILERLDISNYFCLILSQQHLEKQLALLQQNETSDQNKIYSVAYYNYYALTHHYITDHIDAELDVNADNISSKYVFLNRVDRFHRRVLFALLKQKGLLDQGLVSYGSPDE